jgi:hypothetical protein
MTGTVPAAVVAGAVVVAVAEAVDEVRSAGTGWSTTLAAAAGGLDVVVEEPAATAGVSSMPGMAWFEGVLRVSGIGSFDVPVV